MENEKKELIEIQELMPLCEIFVKSGIFDDTKDVAQAIVKVLAGREIGLSPLQSMMGLYIVRNKVAASAQVISALIKKSKVYNYKILKLDNEECAIEFFRYDDKNVEKSLGVSTFTIKDAARAGVVNGKAWQSFPKNMLFARALTNGARWYCPDTYAGFSVEEVEASIVSETATVSITPEGDVVTNGNTEKGI